MLFSVAVGACSRADGQGPAAVPADKARSDIPADITLAFENCHAAYLQRQMRSWTVVVKRNLLDKQ